MTSELEPERSIEINQSGKEDYGNSKTLQTEKDLEIYKWKLWMKERNSWGYIT